MWKQLKKYKYAVLAAGLVLFAVAVFGYNYTSGANPEVKLPDLPSLSIKTIPETVQPGAEIALTAEYNEFLGSNMFTNWCVDGAPINSFYAGSDDKITLLAVDGNGKEYPDGTKVVKRKVKGSTQEKVYVQLVTKDSKGKIIRQEQETPGAHYEPKIENEWGRLYGGKGFCRTPLWPYEDTDSWSYTDIFVRTGVNHYRESEMELTKALISIWGIENLTFLNPVLTSTTKYVPYPVYKKYAEENKFLSDPLNKKDEAFIVSGTGATREAYRMLKPDEISLYKEKMENDGYEVRCGSAATGANGEFKCKVFESYRYVKMNNIAKSNDKILYDNCREKDTPCVITEVDWNHRDDDNQTVKVRYFSIPILQFDDDKFKQFWQKNFGQKHNNSVLESEEACRSRMRQKREGQCWPFCVFLRDDLKYDCRSDVRYSAALRDAMASVTGKIFESSWKQNRENIGKNFYNPIAISRVFSRIAESNKDKYKEGDLRGGKGGDEGLVMYRDRDQDGLPDLWEMRHFGDMAGKEVKKGNEDKKRVYFPPCCSYGESTKGKADAEVKKIKEKQEKELKTFLNSVAPDADWDADGFDWDEFNIPTYYQPLSAGLGPYIERSKIPGDSSRGMFNKPGDKKFTNYEEFVAGTNPTVADTDSDGISDEMDFYGLDQRSFKMKLNKETTGDNYKVMARAYGKTTRSSYKGQKKSHARADAVKKIKEGGSLSLQVMLSVTPSNTTINDEVKVKAAIGNLQGVDNKSLFYQWYLNGFKVGGGTGKYAKSACPCSPQGLALAEALGKQSGFGQDTFKFKASDGVKTPCLGAEVMLEVTDPKTEQTTVAKTTVPVLINSRFSKTIIANENPDSKSGNSTKKTDKIKDAINKEDAKKGIREGDKVRYEILLDGYKSGACGVAKGESISTDEDKNRKKFMSNLIYRWKVDGVEMKEKSGRGKSKIDIKATLAARISDTNRGSSSSDSSEKDDHYVEVKVFDSNNKLIAHRREGVKVMAAYVGMNPSTGITKGATDENGKQTYTAKKGEKVKIQTIAQYYKPADRQKFTYTWYRNKKQIQQTDAKERSAEFEFVAGGGKNQTSDEIKVTITSKTAQGKEMESNDGSMTIKVIDSSSSGGLSGAQSFIESFVPDSIRSAFNIFMTLGAAALVMVFAFSFVGGDKRN